MKPHSGLAGGRTCGLKDFYIALVQSNTATAYEAGTPVKLARAIKAKIDEKVDKK